MPDSIAEVPARLADLAHGIRYSGIPADVRQRAGRMLVDTTAVSAAGTRHPMWAKLLADGGPGGTGSSVIGRTGGVGAEQAAQANALSATVLQFDEGHRASRGHPGIHVIPAALAVAEEVDATGPQVIEAIVAGYEVAARLGMMLGPLPPAVHPHGAWGVFGAAIAAGKLWGLDAAGLERVTEAVASIPSYPWAPTSLRGSSIHHLFAAIGGSSGVLLGRAVASGASVTPGAFSSFYWPLMSRRAAADFDDAEYVQRESYFKFMPVCAHLITAIEAVNEIQRTEPLAAGDVESIVVSTYSVASELDDAAPPTDLAARFSMPFCIASTILRNWPRPSMLAASELSDQQTLQLASRVRVRHDPELDERYPAHGRPAVVEVTLRSGRRLGASAQLPRGDGARKEPDDEPTWRRKVHTLWGPRADELISFADDSDAGWSARGLGQVLRAWRAWPTDGVGSRERMSEAHA